MKHIIKKLEPVGLEYARQHNLNWDEFHEQCHDSYVACRIQAHEEQVGECAYTGMPLNDSANIHLDHFKKKSIYPNSTFDWNNLFAAIKNHQFGADYKDNYIDGENAANVYPKLLHPALNDPTLFFWYSNTGKIEPKSGLGDIDREKAITTIAVFNLNNETLLSRRRQLFQILQCYQELTLDETLSALKTYGFSFVTCAFYQNQNND